MKYYHLQRIAITVFIICADGLSAQTIQNLQAKKTIDFSVEIPVLRFLGIFKASRNDTVQVHGAFNEWGKNLNDAVMAVDKYDPDVYRTDEKIEIDESGEVRYRYYIGRNSSGVFGNLFYEKPLTTGGVDRLLVTDSRDEIETPTVYFNDLPPAGLIPAGQKITCTLSVNMATAITSGFNPLKDNVYLYLADGWWAATQGEREVGVQADLAFTHMRTLFYELKLEITGPSYYALMYRIAFGPSPDDITMIEGGDLETMPSRVRYIPPKQNGAYPEKFVFPLDNFKPEDSLNVEDSPINPYPPENKSPKINKQFPNFIMRRGQSKTVDLEDAEAFSDPNGDDLTYSVDSDKESAVTAEMKGKDLHIDAVGLGTASITLSAEDEAGAVTDMTFFVTVVDQNSSPVVENSFEDITMTVNSGKRERVLAGVFSDPDEDRLDYRVESSDPEVAEATVEASVLFIDPKKVGVTRIRVTADDNRGGEAADEFQVTVASGNLPPRVATAMTPFTFAFGDQPFERDLNASPVIFEDPNGDSLSYSAFSNNDKVVRVEFLASLLVMTPVKKGVATIAVIAEDEAGEQASLDFEVTVEAVQSNNPPRISQTIEDQLIKTGGNAFTRNLAAPPVIFDDPDEDALSYTAWSSNNRVASVNLYGTTLTVASGELGTAIITVKAGDGKNGWQELDFQVTVAENVPPGIEHDAIIEGTAGERIVVGAELFDDTGIVDGILHYRRGGDPSFTLVAMLDEQGWQATIPAGEVTARGLEYFIRAIDQNTASAQTDTFAIRVRVAGNGIFSDNPQPAGSEQTGFRLFSAPLDLDDAQPAAVLEDDLGKYNIKKWRFFELAPNQNYVEFDSIAAITPGKAYWLIVREPGKTVRTGAGVSQPLRELFPVPVSPGWNFIGNPFNFPLSRNNLRLGGDGSSPSLRYFEEYWRDPSEAQTIQPFAGYAFFLNSLESDTIWVNPQPADELTSAKPADPTTPDWAIRILAHCQNARDEDNLAGIHPNAHREWDALDQPEPPVIGEYVSVRFPRPDWEMPAVSYATDFRPALAFGEIWRFQIKTNIRDKVDLQFEGLETVPEAYEIFLFDEDVEVLRNLRKSPGFSFTAFKNERPKTLKLMVGLPEFFDEALADDELLPKRFELSQNFPNPFNPSTTIRFGVPKTAKVHLVIYNLLGEQILTLIDRQKFEPGYHTIVWDGRDSVGRPLASGVYVYRLISADEVFTKKMILVK